MARTTIARIVRRECWKHTDPPALPRCWLARKRAKTPGKRGFLDPSSKSEGYGPGRLGNGPCSRGYPEARGYPWPEHAHGLTMPAA